MALRFILRFVLPILNITRAAQDRLQQMQKQMDEMNRQAEQTQQRNEARARVKQTDYVDYEEVN